MSDPKKFEKLLNVILIIMLLAVITADRNPELRDFGVVFVVLTAIATSFAAVHFGHFSFMKSEGLRDGCVSNSDQQDAKNIDELNPLVSIGPHATDSEAYYELIRRLSEKSAVETGEAYGRDLISHLQEYNNITKNMFRKEAQKVFIGNLHIHRHDHKISLEVRDNELPHVKRKRDDGRQVYKIVEDPDRPLVRSVFE